MQIILHNSMLLVQHTRIDTDIDHLLNLLHTAYLRKFFYFIKYSQHAYEVGILFTPLYKHK